LCVLLCFLFIYTFHLLIFVFIHFNSWIFLTWFVFPILSLLFYADPIFKFPFRSSFYLL
jgi:hypothetical protein